LGEIDLSAPGRAQARRERKPLFVYQENAFMKSRSKSFFNISTVVALAASLLGGGLSATPAHADSSFVYFAVPGGMTTGLCDTWANGCTLVRALSLATGVGDRVWVKAGVHKPDVSDPGNAALSFNILPGQAVYGGFDGTETLVTERDPAANVTILSGDIGSDDTNTDGNNIDETWNDIVPGNSYHVVYMNGTSTPIHTYDTVLDGFTITGGYANLGGSNYGGGLRCNASSSGECSPALSQLTFSGNRAEYGGAIFNEGPSGGVSSPTLSDVTFNGNHANSWGGAIYNWGNAGTSSPSLINVTFSGNSAVGYGGAILNDGQSGGTSSPGLTNVTFSGNSADVAGGAMTSFAPTGTSSPTLNNVILWGDIAPDGPEVYDFGGTPTIDYSVVDGGCGSISSATCGTGNLSADPKLDPSGPANNGGSTRTIALMYGSSAIDVGTTCSAFDQRGLARPVNSICDIGAYEAPTQVSVPGTCYVDAHASGTPGGGTSWPDAYIHLQAALADAQCTEIWVADGLYLPGAHVSDSFNVLPDVAVYGGFAGGETLRTARAPATNVAVLSGDIDNNDTNKDIDGVTPTAGDIVGSNAYHIAVMDGTVTYIGTSTVLDGFTVTAGQATGSGGWKDLGGGLLCKGSGGQCSPLLAQLMIVGNKAKNGGGMFLSGAAGIASPTLTDVVFKANRATVGHGGGMYNEGFGGVSDPDMTNVTFAGNTANLLGGAMYNDGTFSGESSPSITNATFDGNSAGDSGGAMYNDGTGGTSAPLLAKITFSDNHAPSGGGGAMVNNGASPNLGNVTFFGNSAGYAGAMYNVALSGDSTAPSVMNSTFSGNTGGAIYNDSNGVSLAISLLLSNVILWGDTGIFPEIGNDTAFEDVTIDHSVIEGGCASILGGIVTCGAGNFSTNPNLDPGGLASNGGSSKTLALMAGSSAIDNGWDLVCPFGPVNGLDQRGVYRPQGPHCDIGAYEKELPAAEMIRVLPDPDSTVCPLPIVGVQVYILDSILSDTGSPDPVKTQLKLDGVDVSGLAMNMETLGSPVAQVIVRYTPAGDLALGLHDAMFTYPSPGGPRTRVWSFTVASIPCDVLAGGPIDALGAVDPSQTGPDGGGGAAPAPAGGRQP
jgi:hypothetical protein